jgi:hypothetical protein
VKFWGKWTGNIKREIGAEGVGWFVGGGWTLRQIKGLIIVAPAILALLFLKEGILRNILVGVCVAGWFVWQIVTWAIGQYYFAKKMDRYYDRKVRANLSKEYRKR